MSTVRFSAHGPLVTAGGGAVGQRQLQMHWLVLRVPGQLTTSGTCGPWLYLNSWPSISSVRLRISLSIRTGRTVTRYEGVAVPLAKKASRMRCACWNERRMPSPPGSVLPSTPG